MHQAALLQWVVKDRVRECHCEWGRLPRRWNPKQSFWYLFGKFHYELSRQLHLAVLAIAHTRSDILEHEASRPNEAASCSPSLGQDGCQGGYSPSIHCADHYISGGQIFAVKYRAPDLHHQETFLYYWIPKITSFRCFLVNTDCLLNNFPSKNCS